MFESQTDYWREDNLNAIPRLSINNKNNYYASDIWVKNAGYVRLKNVSLATVFPKDYLEAPPPDFASMSAGRISSLRCVRRLRSGRTRLRFQFIRLCVLLVRFTLIMKVHKYPILLLCVLSMTSCAEDFLNRYPSKPTTGDFFKSEEAAKLALTGIYNGLYLWSRRRRHVGYMLPGYASYDALTGLVMTRDENETLKPAGSGPTTAIIAYWKSWYVIISVPAPCWSMPTPRSREHGVHRGAGAPGHGLLLPDFDVRRRAFHDRTSGSVQVPAHVEGHDPRFRAQELDGRPISRMDRHRPGRVDKRRPGVCRVPR